METRRSLGALLALGMGILSAGDVSEPKVDMPGEKKPLTWKAGDAAFTLRGRSNTQYKHAQNAVMLNKHLPDDFGYFRETFDTNLGFVYGEKKYDHNAIELSTTIRFRTIWGKVGYMECTENNEPYKISDEVGITPGDHYHLNSEPFIWIYDAWLQASVNAILGAKSDKLHFLKLGMFSFELGRGVALGSMYGVSKDFLGLFSRETEYTAPGILLTGEIVKDMLWYDIYYAKFEEKSASFNDVFNSNKERVVGRRLNPWSGPAKDSDLIAGRVKIKPFKKASMGVLDLEPYAFYNEASDQTAEIYPDSKAMLGSVGLATEYKYKNFEIGGEVAFNYGHERLFPIDRNQVVLTNAKYGDGTNGEKINSIHQVYSKVTYSDDTKPIYNGKKVIVSTGVDPLDNTEKAITNARIAGEGASQNGIIWSPNPADVNGVGHYKNASNRYRPSYNNKFRGWMGLIDTSYLFDRVDLKVAAAYGYASGDKDPRTDEHDKTYKGFIGLHELYAGKRVTSLMILDQRRVRRPVTLNANTGETNSDPTLTDMQFVGGGLTWEPTNWKHYFSLNPNILGFWKVADSPKFDMSLNDGYGAVSPTEKARKYLGTECNLITTYELIKDLSIIGSFAVFFPGSYYTDVKGTPLKGDLFNRLELTDDEDLPSAPYRLGTDTAYYAQIELEYKF